MRQLWIGVALVPFATACGAGMAPNQKMTDAKAAVQAAEAVEAERYPDAALHLKLARDQIATAEELIAHEEHEDAAMVLDRAEADAEVALLHAKAEDTKMQAEQAMQRVSELRKE